MRRGHTLPTVLIYETLYLYNVCSVDVTVNIYITSLTTSILCDTDDDKYGKLIL